MIQTQTEILIKDNSGLLKGRVINCKSKACGVGNPVKIAITKAKSKHAVKKNPGGIHITMKSQLQDLLIIQSKKPIMRYDGSSVTFNANCGVAITITKDFKLQLGFKRINTSVPFEVKKINAQQTFRGSYNIVKLAKNLI